MDHYAGIDVSLETSSVCILDATGCIVREAKVASEPDALVAFLAGCGHRLARIGLEAGPLSQWLHAGLVEAGLPAVLVETRHVKAALSAMTVKTDRNDARGIAQLIRMGWFRPVHAKTLLAQEVRTLLTARKQMQSKLLDLEGSIRGLLRGFGLKVGPVGAAGFERRIRELVAGQATLERVMEPMLRARQALRAEYMTLHRDLLQIVRADEVCRRLMTVPGVGAVVAITFTSAVDDPARFRRSKDVGAHFGLTPRKYQSGETDRTGRISKVGDAMARTMLFEAANVMLTRVARFSALKAWAVRVAGRHGMAKAKVALARKLAIVLHRMWVDGTEFRWGREPAAAAA
jgi:transposase